MITNNGSGADLRCVSGDTKPAAAPVNTLILEVDTGDFYYFDGTDWQKVGGDS